MANHLEDGGLNSQALRNLIVSNLGDIKAKLKGSARGKLLNSLTFMEDGLVTFGNLLDKQAAPSTSGEEDKNDASAEEEDKINIETATNTELSRGLNGF